VLLAYIKVPGVLANVFQKRPAAAGVLLVVAVAGRHTNLARFPHVYQPERFVPSPGAFLSLIDVAYAQ
jgi:hypothetical protein